MKTMKIFAVVGVLAVAVIACSSDRQGFSSATVPPAGDGGSTADGGVTAEAGLPEAGPPVLADWKDAIGTPSWEPYGALTMSISGGSKADGFAGFFAEVERLTPHRFSTVLSCWGPGDAHEGPYETELDRLLASSKDKVKTTFTVDEFTAPSQVITFVVLVPKPGSLVGITPDGEMAMMRNDLFGFGVEQALLRNGTIFDQDPLATYPAAKVFTAPTPVDGHSHILMVLGESMEFAPAGVDAPGSYEYKVRITDSAGNGWKIHPKFVVQ